VVRINSSQDEIMDMKQIVAHGRRVIAGVLIFGAIAGYWPPKRMLAAPPSQASRTNSQLRGESAADTSLTTIVAKVSVSRQQQKTIVQVSTSGTPVYQAIHLSDPERLVLDFQRARLAIPATTPSSYEPVFRIRAGQFQPDVVRVVIDLRAIAPYRINLEENTVTVEFGTAESATASNPPPNPPPNSPLLPGPSSSAGGPPQESSAAPVVKDAEPRAVPERPAAPPPHRAVRAPTTPEPLSVEPGFSNGMLTFRAQNQTLRSALASISTQSGIAINMGADVGNEPLSVEFRRYRIDEALRQMLKDYDTFFFYAGDDGNQAATSLRAVWVYPEGRGPRFASFK
jgi:hypothetical protein